jgi:autotransporter-associated beta strand protein
MKHSHLPNFRFRFIHFTLLSVATLATTFLGFAAPAHSQRVKGLDTSSAANGSAPSEELWEEAWAQDYRFAFFRSSRGGTTAAAGQFFDSQFYTNTQRANDVGMLTGSYHFTRADLNNHTGADEAAQYIAAAGMYMRPGYLLPVVDMESQFTNMTPLQLTNFIMEVVTTIESQKGITPIIYSNASYANDEITKAVAFTGTTPRTYHWLARPGSNGLTGNPPPASNIPNPYGMWDPAFTARTSGGVSISRDPAIKPWAFWQQTLDVTPAGLFKIDIDYANGNMEFVKDFLVPAIWTTNGSGEWTDNPNWNSYNPAGGTPATGPASRLPNSLDWIKLQNGSHTVTLSSGDQSARKFYTQQPLNITGGSLTIGYVPGSGGKWDLPSEFNAAVTISGTAGYSAHTTQVNGATGVFNVNGGTLTFTEVQLASHSTTPGRIVMGGDAIFTPTGGAGTAVIRSIGALAQAGEVSLTAGDRGFSVINGSAGVDLNVRTRITGAGKLVKSGAGTMQLSSTNTFAAGTTISSGVLQIAADDRLGTAPVSFDSDNITLDGGTLRTGAQISSASLTNAGSGYTSFPVLTIGGAGGNVHPASASVLARVGTIAVTSGGSGYINQVSAPTAGTPGTFVDIVGGGGSGATAFATVSGGVVTGITITNPGSGYTSMPTVYISSTANPSLAGAGATAAVSGITVQSIALNDGGFDYGTPTISLTGGGGSGAAASATATSDITLNSSRGITLGAAGGTLEQTQSSMLTIPGAIASSGNGILTKSGAGSLILTGANTYTGGTVVTAGLLAVTGGTATLGAGNVTVQSAPVGSGLLIQSSVDNAIGDSATLSLFGGGTPNVADQGFAFLEDGVNEFVGKLVLNGVTQPAGSYGGSDSSALYKLSEYFNGTGKITVITLPGDYNVDGIVDGADYVMWQKNVGQPAGILPNDNTEVIIGDAQYDLMRANFGNVLSSGGGGDETVPEPSTVAAAMLLTFVAACAARRRK